MCTLKLGVLQKEPVLRQTRKTNLKPLLDKVKKMWKRILHLMQQHNTPRKG